LSRYYIYLEGLDDGNLEYTNMKVPAEETLDPSLRECLELLRPVPRRKPVAAAQAKANFLAELEVTFELDQRLQPGLFSYPARWLNHMNIWARNLQVSFMPFPRTALSISSILLIVVVLLFSWVGFTARAAETALPGDTLYSFKTNIEQVQVALAGDLDKQAGLYIEFATHRLQEIESLVDTGRFQKAVALSAKFHFNIQKALDITNELAKVDPARAAQRRNEINAQLASFATQLGELLVKMPPSYQPAFINVIPPSLFGQPAPVAPLVNETPAPAGQQDTPQDANTNQQKQQNNAPDAGNNAGSNSGSEIENNSNNSSEEPGGIPFQEGLNNNPEQNDHPNSEVENSNEGIDPEHNQPGDGNSTNGEQHLDGHEIQPPETIITNPRPPHSSD
jgi:hypothetical protein